MLDVARFLLDVNTTKLPLPKHLNSFTLESLKKSNHIVAKNCQFNSEKRLTLNLVS